MNPLLQKAGLGLVVLAMLYVGWTSWRWAGVALVVGGVVFWMLLYFTRLVQVLQRAAKRPKGYVDSAVMVNARLRPGVNLMWVLALTRSLGEEVSKEPEVWRWTDNSGSTVTLEFTKARLAKWTLVRPPAEEDADTGAAQAAAAAVDAPEQARAGS